MFFHDIYYEHIKINGGVSKEIQKYNAFTCYKLSAVLFDIRGTFVL